MNKGLIADVELLALRAAESEVGAEPGSSDRPQEGAVGLPDPDATAGRSVDPPVRIDRMPVGCVVAKLGEGAFAAEPAVFNVIGTNLPPAARFADVKGPLIGREDEPVRLLEAVGGNIKPPCRIQPEDEAATLLRGSGPALATTAWRSMLDGKALS